MSKSSERILVTGADGFIGRNLVKSLKEKGYSVVTYDIGDGDISVDRISFENVSHVFHLAGMTYVPNSWENPYLFYRTNVLGTTNILEFCRLNGCSLTIPSTYMYGNPKYLPVDEVHPIEANISPYHNSKYLCEEVTSFYSSKFGVPCTILRLFNVYGSGQNDNFIIPHLVREILSDSKQITVKDLEPKRDYVYIDDVVDALIKSIRKTDSLFRIYNVGSGKSYNVLELSKIIMDVYGVEKNVMSLNERRLGEIMNTIADISKISEELEWYPKWELDEGIRDIKNIQSSSQKKYCK